MSDNTLIAINPLSKFAPKSATKPQPKALRAYTSTEKNGDIVKDVPSKPNAKGMVTWTRTITTKAGKNTVTQFQAPKSWQAGSGQKLYIYQSSAKLAPKIANEEQNPLLQGLMGASVGWSQTTIGLAGRALRKTGVPIVKNVGQGLIDLHEKYIQASAEDGSSIGGFVVNRRMNPNGTAAKIGDGVQAAVTLFAGGEGLVKVGAAAIAKVPVAAKMSAKIAPKLAKGAAWVAARPKIAKGIAVGVTGAMAAQLGHELATGDIKGFTRDVALLGAGGVAYGAKLVKAAATGMRNEIELAIKNHSLAGLKTGVAKLKKLQSFAAIVDKKLASIIQTLVKDYEARYDRKSFSTTPTGMAEGEIASVSHGLPETAVDRHSINEILPKVQDRAAVHSIAQQIFHDDELRKVFSDRIRDVAQKNNVTPDKALSILKNADAIVAAKDLGLTQAQTKKLISMCKDMDYKSREKIISIINQDIWFLPHAKEIVQISNSEKLDLDAAYQEYKLGNPWWQADKLGFTEDQKYHLFEQCKHLKFPMRKKVISYVKEHPELLNYAKDIVKHAETHGVSTDQAYNALKATIGEFAAKELGLDGVFKQTLVNLCRNKPAAMRVELINLARQHPDYLFGGYEVADYAIKHKVSPAKAFEVLKSSIPEILAKELKFNAAKTQELIILCEYKSPQIRERILAFVRKHPDCMKHEREIYEYAHRNAMSIDDAFEALKHSLPGAMAKQLKLSKAQKEELIKQSDGQNGFMREQIMSYVLRDVGELEYARETCKIAAESGITFNEAYKIAKIYSPETLSKYGSDTYEQKAIFAYVKRLNIGQRKLLMQYFESHPSLPNESMYRIDMYKIDHLRNGGI